MQELEHASVLLLADLTTKAPSLICVLVESELKGVDGIKFQMLGG